jgi:hypothetical protein
VEGDQAGDEITHSIFPLHSPGGKAHSDSEKAEIRNHSLDTQIQLVTDLSVPAVIEMVDVALRSYILTPDNEPNLTDPD